MFWARGDPKADQGHDAGLVAFICLDLAEENKAMLISQPVGVNDVWTLTEIMSWDDMKVLIAYMTFKHVHKHLCDRSTCFGAASEYLCLNVCAGWRAAARAGDWGVVWCPVLRGSQQVLWTSKKTYHSHWCSSKDFTWATPTSPSTLTEWALCWSAADEFLNRVRSQTTACIHIHAQ